MKNSILNHLTKYTTVIALSAVMSLSAHAQSNDDAVYRGLGEKAGINNIVADFLPLVLADGRINLAFKDTDIERLGMLLSEQFCQLSGGPCRYSGKNMQDAHRGMNITNAQFNALAEDLQIAMEKNAIPSSIQNKLIAKLAPMQATVVTK